MSIQFQGNPFFLQQEQIQWVQETLASLTAEEKIGQLLCPSLSMFSEKTIDRFAKELKIGSMMIRPFGVKGLQDNLRKLQNASRVPLLISANLESGGNGAIKEGTLFAMPEGCSATGDPINGYRLGKISCEEAASVGVNWGYAPIVDIDMNFRNPITNIRSFGNDKNVVLSMAQGYLKAAKEAGVAPTIKHFPGDGVDERDQHLLVSVNSLSNQDWMDSFGMIYSRLIEDGVPTIMAGHIAQPAVARAIDPSISDADAFLPGSQSKTLLTGLLRNRLGFNGVIVTDSTLMVGFMQCMPRRLAIPLCVEHGIDIILFNRSIEEDFDFLIQGLRDGILSQQRLDEAVARILALKASLNLPAKQKAGTIVPNVDPLTVIRSSRTKQWVLDCADQAVTLVKDRRGLLPISPEKTPRVYLNVMENYVANQSELGREWKKRLEKEGFSVELRKRKLDLNPNLLTKGVITPTLIKVMKEIMANTDSFVSKYDMCVIVLHMETVSNATVVRVNWKVMFGLGNDIPWYAGEMPLLVVSTANPYHLLDIPMAHAYINAYTGNPATLDAVFDKLMGRSVFKGISPVDPFCGHEDCRL